ncbi:hypothetical protein SAMN05660653_01391 [Desulfonatronum thiosulfatophilum]|uniref:Uncharacterized protein n=1 Tax=Desulfonatronum thiosulfatophilum TaxID=617002 RepID=A0A1G6C852_9BACT|nr:hypothetical protein [Desulfonatronum thiosulfatophilum]SDB29069.1 hypothetical protein SAMN05660653_01391 [Desulfonatronum thiosulfatophilum]
MNKSMAICVGLLLAISTMIWGCAGNLPESQRIYYLQDNWGRSVQTANYNQTLNPTAGLTKAPVEGIDPKAAAHSVERYRESFKDGVEREQVSPIIIMGN